MTYTNFVLTHSTDGFTIWREERKSYTRDYIAGIADRLCEATGHRWCHRWAVIWDWADKHTVVSKKVLISDETAFALSNDDEWEWVREDD